MRISKPIITKSNKLFSLNTSSKCFDYDIVKVFVRNFYIDLLGYNIYFSLFTMGK